LNADAAFTKLPITVGGNVHLIAGKQTVTNMQDRKLFQCLSALLVDLERR